MCNANHSAYLLVMRPTRRMRNVHRQQVCLQHEAATQPHSHSHSHSRSLSRRQRRRLHGHAAVAAKASNSLTCYLALACAFALAILLSRSLPTPNGEGVWERGAGRQATVCRPKFSACSTCPGAQRGAGGQIARTSLIGRLHSAPTARGGSPRGV